MWIRKTEQLQRNWRKWALGLGCVSVAILTFCLGRYGAMSQAKAAPPTAAPALAPLPSSAPSGPDLSSDYANRVVAYVFGNVPVTRQQLGEYLIARYGMEKLPLFVNKLIIDRACEEQGITVTEAEIEAALINDIKAYGLNRGDFIKKVLKQHLHTTLYEWKEDVLRPQLLLSKLVRNKVRVENDDLQKAFESYYGEKIECQMIVWPPNEYHIATKMYDQLRKDANEFDRAARTQAAPSLAATGGRIKPFGKHAIGNADVERVAFSLQEGEITPIMQTKEGCLVIKLLKKIPPDTTARLEDHRADFEKEILEKKIQMEIPKLFAIMRQKAMPKLFLQTEITEQELRDNVQRELSNGSLPAGPFPMQQSQGK